MKKLISVVNKKTDFYQKIFYLLFAVLFLILLINRSFPYFLYGPFGFGYDTGIYKKEFEQIFNFYDILHSEISLFPSFLAYLFNFFSIPLKFFLYHFYILFSALISIPLYLLTKECFSRKEGVLAISIFSLSYIQILASEFYLYSAILGAIFLLFAILYYTRKSYLFYIFAFLLGLTQLPQFLILIFVVGISVFFDFKKYLKFHLISLLVFVVVFGILIAFDLNYLLSGLDVVISSLKGITRVDSHYSGFFLTVGAYIRRALLILIIGFVGYVMSFLKDKELKNKKRIPLQIAAFFVFAVVFLKLFFEERYIFELDLLLIPFVSYFVIKIFGKIVNYKIFLVTAGVFLVLASSFLSFWYYKTTNPALSGHEIWAIDFISQQRDADYAMVTNTIYAPWIYGFSDKKTLAPGIFESVWDFDIWLKYIYASEADKAQMHLDIAEKYGTYYLFLGFRQQHPELEKYSKNIKKLFDVQNATVFQISAP